MKNNIMANVLLVEDSPELATLYMEYLKQSNLIVEYVTTGESAINYLQRISPDIVLLDYVLPDMTGQKILEYIADKNIQCQVIVLTAHATVESAITCIRLKTFDFLIKPFDANTLLKTISNAVSYQLQSKTSPINNDIAGSDYLDFHGFIGKSPPMQHIYSIIENSARSIASVFITGDSGTGKEVCALALHNLSSRTSKPFIAINCAAIPRDLMESEIFGHLKGSFTGASSDRQGAASLAHQGTLFLDEVCEMNLDLQTKLLRFVQTGTFQKVGSSKVETVDIRFICATNRNVLEEVKQKNFREDLYYRLHVIPIEMPKVCERGEDIIDIADFFLTDYSNQENKNFQGFSEDCKRFLMSYQWPGNVRELQNVIRNIVVLNDAEIATYTMLPKHLIIENNTESFEPNNGNPEKTRPSVINQQTTDVIAPLWESEKKTIEETIAKCDGNIPRAAALLGISPSTIYRKIESWKKASVIQNKTPQN